MGGRAGGGGASMGSRSGGFASGVGRFKESDVKIINLKDKFFDNNGRIQTFKSNAYGYSVNGKVLTKNGQIWNAGSKFGAEVFKSTTVTEKGLGSAAPYKGAVDTMHFY